jgi:hypothetical protein
MSSPARHISLIGFTELEESELSFIIGTKKMGTARWIVHKGRVANADCYVTPATQLTAGQKAYLVGGVDIEGAGRWCGNRVDLLEAIFVACKRKRGPKKRKDKTNVERNPE